MCGIIGIIGTENAAEELYRGLISLQHRGQDAAGIITFSTQFHEVKNNGLVQSVFNEQSIKKLKGNSGIGHVRYSTMGEGNVDEAQPFQNTEFLSVSMCHNGNLTNYTELKKILKLNTSNDLEAILEIFVTKMDEIKLSLQEKIFESAGHVIDTIKGGYSVLAHVPQIGLVAFRDPYGIKPLVYGKKDNSYCFASETVALDTLGYCYLGSVNPGEVIIVQKDGQVIKKQIREQKVFSPCIFELIYFARPTSVIENISVSGFRYQLGKSLSKSSKISKLKDIDLVTDVPSTSTRSAIAFANETNIYYRPIFDRNNYIGRSFIESSDFKRKHAILLKFAIDIGLLNELTTKLKRGVRLIKIDDSFVRGTTNSIINSHLRDTKMIDYIVDCSLSPRIEWPCVYGIDMSISTEFVARGKSDEQIAESIGANEVIYTPRETLSCVAKKFGLKSYCEACFSGKYPTGLSKEELTTIEKERIKCKNH